MSARVALLASYPPPHGGVANHVQRLMRLLDARGLDYVVYNAVSAAQGPPRVRSVARGRRRWLLRYALTTSDRAVYIFSDRLSVWLAGGLMAALRDKRVAIRLRNSVLPDLLARPGWRTALACWSLRRMTTVVGVSRRLVDAAIAAGVATERVIHAPGFLPPDAAATDRDGVHRSVWEFIAGKDPLFAANGKVNWYQGEDLYGLDLLVELAARLVPDFPRLGIVVCFWHHRPEDQARLDELRARASDAGVADHLLFNTEPGFFVPVLAEADLFVRPTNTDGDANSVREALYLGVPAIASDVVERPEGTIRFRNRDLDDFERQVRAVLSEGGRRGAPAATAKASVMRGRIDTYLDAIAGLVAD